MYEHIYPSAFKFLYNNIFLAIAKKMLECSFMSELIKELYILDVIKTRKFTL
jgi:hypothetical protein